MKNILYIIIFFLFQHLAAQTPRQVLDLIPVTTSTFNDIQDKPKIGVGNRVLFVVYRQFKYELWSSDGSEAGTTNAPNSSFVIRHSKNSSFAPIPQG